MKVFRLAVLHPQLVSHFINLDPLPRQDLEKSCDRFSPRLTSHHDVSLRYVWIRLEAGAVERIEISKISSPIFCSQRKQSAARRHFDLGNIPGPPETALPDIRMGSVRIERR